MLLAKLASKFGIWGGIFGIGFSGPRAWGYRQARFGDEPFFRIATLPYYYGPTPTRVRLYDRRQRCGKDRALSLLLLLLLLLLFTAIIDRAITRRRLCIINRRHLI